MFVYTIWDINKGKTVKGAHDSNNVAFPRLVLHQAIKKTSPLPVFISQKFFLCNIGMGYFV
jgi:hypothetical protein